MKPKLKLDSGKLKAAVVKHFEKVLFAVVGLCFVWLVYSAMSVERFNGTPEELQQVSTQTQTHLDNQTFSPEAKAQANLVSTAEFREAMTIDPDQESINWKDFDPADKPTVRRAAPKVFGPTAMQARGGIGAIVVVADQATLLRRQMTTEEEAEEAARKAREDAEKAAREAGESRGAGGGGGYGGYPGGGAAARGGGGGYPGTPGAGGGRGEGGGRGTGGGRGARNRGESPYGAGAPGMTAAPETEEVVEMPMVVPTPEQIIKGVRWVCLTGVVPGKKQFEEFKKAAGKDFPMAEGPRYHMFEVQRADYMPGKQPTDSDWQDVNVLKAVLDARKEWAAQYPEVADPEKVNPGLAMPLPPLVTRNWGNEVVHAPEIERLDPLAMMDRMVLLQKQLKEAEAEAKKAGQQPQGDGSGSEQPPLQPGPTDPPAESWDTVIGGGGPGGGYGGRPGGEGGMRPPGGYGGRGGGNLYGGRPGSSPYGGREGGSPYGGGGPGMMANLTPPEHYLLRFFDFTVDSGKSYVYRVRLRMVNPNWQMPANQLENPSLKDEQYIYGDWSEITDAARVPGDNALLAGEASISKGPFEPEASVVYEHFDQEKGVMTSVAKKVIRGQMANLPETKIKYLDPIKLTVEEFEGVEIDTDMTVVDILGGTRVGKNSAKVAPGRMLTMDSEGNFEVREELTDRTAFASADEKRKRVEEVEKLGPGAGAYGPAPGAGGSPYGGGANPYGPPGGSGGRPYGPPGGGGRE